MGKAGKTRDTDTHHRSRLAIFVTIPINTNYSTDWQPLRDCIFSIQLSHNFPHPSHCTSSAHLIRHAIFTISDQYPSINQPVRPSVGDGRWIGLDWAGWRCSVRLELPTLPVPHPSGAVRTTDVCTYLERIFFSPFFLAAVNLLYICIVCPPAYLPPPLALLNFRYRHSLLVRQLAAVLWRCWRCCCCCCCFVSAPSSVAPSFPLSVPTILPGAKAEGSGVMVLLLQPAGECPPAIERRVRPPADSVAFPRAYARTGDDQHKKKPLCF